MTIDEKSLDTSPPSCSPSEVLSSLYSQRESSNDDSEARCNVFLYKEDKYSPHVVMKKNEDEPSLLESECADSHNNVQNTNSSEGSGSSRTFNNDWFAPFRNIRMYKLSCHSAQIFTPIGMLRIFLLICSFLSLLCVVSCHSNEQTGFIILPSANRLIFHVITCTISVIITFLLLLTEVTNFIQFLYRTSCNWPFCEAVVKGILCVLLIISTSLVLHLLLEYGSKYRWVSFTTRGLLLASVIFGYLSMFCAFILAIISWLGQDEYRIFQEESRRNGNEYLVT